MKAIKISIVSLFLVLSLTSSAFAQSFSVPAPSTLPTVPNQAGPAVCTASDVDGMVGIQAPAAFVNNGYSYAFVFSGVGMGPGTEFPNCKVIPLINIGSLIEAMINQEPPQLKKVKVICTIVTEGPNGSTETEVDFGTFEFL